VSTGRLVALWYAGLLLAAVLVHWALGNAESIPLSAALLAGAVVIPLILLRYTLTAQGGEFNSQVLAPAIGPIVIAVLIFEYVEYNKRVDEAFSAQLISSDLIQLLDVKWAGADPDHGRVSGRITNRSPHHLIGMSLELLLYSGGQKLRSAAAAADLDVGPGQQANFKMTTLTGPASGGAALSCADERAAAAQAHQPGSPSRLQCVYRLTGTRGEEVTF
jgi:hypothetical protein